jgi:hypothetical protein
MSIIDLYSEDIDQSFKASLERQKNEASRISTECARLTKDARKMDRSCILIDDPLRVSPQEWHAQCIRDASFWLLVAIVPLVLTALLRSRLRFSWIWGLLAVVLSVYASALGIGYFSFFYSPLEYDSNGNLLRKDLVFTTATTISLVVFLIGLACNPYTTVFAESLTKSGAAQRLRLLICVASLLTSLGAALLLMVDGSWDNFLVWNASTYSVYKQWSFAFRLSAWSFGIFLASVALPPLYGHTIGRVFRWVRNGR